jgi:hypothetical protein
MPPLGNRYNIAPSNTSRVFWRSEVIAPTALGAPLSEQPQAIEDDGYGGSHFGNLRSEHHFGGRGNDLLVDVSRCGPGVDRVHYNKGLDKVADDCEDLRPYRY